MAAGRRTRRMTGLALAAMVAAGAAGAAPAGAATGDVVPTLRCVMHHPEWRELEARFGWVNTTGAEVSAPVSSDNFMAPPPGNRGQPTWFADGRVEDGFTMRWSLDDFAEATWALFRLRVTAGHDRSRYCPADMALEQTADRTTAAVGDTITYTLAVTADGGLFPASRATVTQVLPPGTTLLSATSPAGTCTGTAPVRCSVAAPAPGGPPATVTVAVRADAPGTLAATGRVGVEGAAEVDPADDLATASVHVTAPPQAVTVGAGSVTRTGAALTGVVDPRGQDTTYAFEYGPTAAYGATTPAAAAPAGGAAPVGATLSGLRSGTTYHVRVVATNASGTTRGAGATFTTEGRAPR